MPALLLIIRFFRSIWSGLKDPDFRGLFILVVLIILAGTWFYHVQEGWSWLDALYFTVITLTTVGYGDFSPATPGGKIFTMIYILLGLGILSSFIVMMAQHSQNRQPRLLDKLRASRKDRGEENSE